MNGRRGKWKNFANLLLPPLSALAGTFPHEWEKGVLDTFKTLLLPFMGEMASGQRGRRVSDRTSMI
jgi:hypothetical protein